MRSALSIGRVTVMVSMGNATPACAGAIRLTLSTRSGCGFGVAGIDGEMGGVSVCGRGGAVGFAAGNACAETMAVKEAAKRIVSMWSTA